ncbi:hypothetical protein GIB67_034049 [Kingdonia uniflora]|uniref:Factor of DNA methylation 1-5/IDN2 domain-containing protein n=1 Tax=Kingdonia uniflora TaxID=39325 RepID=A0A7J7M6C1_9MAGN|nr:hypothetical protein GIB67_034049 [Kingdonia uniflora]
MTNNIHEELQRLRQEIDYKNCMLEQKENKCNALSTFLSKIMEEKNTRRIMEEKDTLCKSYMEEMRRMQAIRKEYSRKLYQDNEELKRDFECRSKKLEDRSKQLKIREAQVLIGQQNLSSAWETLKTQLEIMKWRKLDVKCIGDGDNFKIQEKMDVLSKELEDALAELEAMETTNTTLFVKERISNDEVQEARKVLIKGLHDLNANRRGKHPTIGVKRLGELRVKPFRDACKNKYLAEECDVKSAALCSEWQELMKDSGWYPFRRANIDGKLQVDENDEKLKELKSQWGGEVFDAVAVALMEINENNASGGYSVPELWNFKEERKASLKEVVEHILKQLKIFKSKRK